MQPLSFALITNNLDDGDGVCEYLGIHTCLDVLSDDMQSRLSKQGLIDAIVRSGGKQYAIRAADIFLERLECLQLTGRYQRLLSQLLKANDESNFLALVLEANFAFHFERQKLCLYYEVKSVPQCKSSVDFLLKQASGDDVYFELCLLQRGHSVVRSIIAQLQRCRMYHMVMGGQAEKDSVVRIQNTVLGKIQDKHGNPTKFNSVAANAKAVNIVVVNVTDSILGTIDVQDCKLVTYGDRSVEDVYRRQIFGLFQEDDLKYPLRIHRLAAKYAHIRNMLHGVLFLFKRPGTEILSYELEQYMMWNPGLINAARAQVIFADIVHAIPVRT